MSDTVVATSEFRELVQKAAAAGSLSALIEEIDRVTEEKVVVKPPTKQQRINQWKQDKNEMDLDKVQRISDVLSTYVEKFFVDRVDMQEPRELTQEEVDKLAQEYLDLEQMSELITSRHQMMRWMTFQSLNEKYASEDEKMKVDAKTPPQQRKGRLESQAFGRAFCREGGNRTPAAINWSRLRAELPADVFNEVCDAEIIPEHVEYTPNEKKFMAAVLEGRVPMELLRDAMVPGKWQTPKFQVRKI